MARMKTVLPDRVREAFEGNTYLSLQAMADAFQLSTSTLRRHANQGTLPAHSKGFGEYRTHRAFTIGDAEVFWRNLQPAVTPPMPRKKHKRATPAGVEKRNGPG
jgi:hypothetical protein